MKIVSLLTLFSVLVMSAAADAQPKDCLPLTPTGTQGGALLPRGLMNVRFGGTAVSPLALDVYPHADAAVRPLVVVLRGGMGTIGQRSSYVGQLVETLGDAGYVVATADYRSPSLDASAEDLTAALRLLTMCHAATLHVDQDKVVLVAEDTAAPMALLVAARLKELRLGRLAGAPAPPVAVVVVGGRFANAPAPAVPTRIVHGGADSEVPVTGAHALCRQASADCDVVEVAGASHRAENWWPSQWPYKAALLAWLQPHVGAVPAPASARPASATGVPQASARQAPAGGGLRKRIVYDQAHGLSLDAWVPSGSTARPAVVLVHGGGWEAGDRVTYIAPMFALAASKGWAWVSIDYRLTPHATNREQATDVRSALAYVRAHAADLRIDPARLVLVGESASGQLVTHVAASEPGLAGVVSFYGVYDLVQMAGDPANPRSLAHRLFRITRMDAEAQATLRDYSPVYHASKDLPPLLLIAGTADRLVAQQRAYASALKAVGARVDTFEIENAPHGMEAWHEEPAWRVWEKQVADWIQRTIK